MNPQFLPFPVKDVTVPRVPTICAIETTTPHASLGLWRDDACLFSADFTSQRHHHALLFAPLQQLIEVLGDAPLDAVIIGTGPGSYSGARVGIAAGQGLAMIHQCPAIGLSSLLATGYPRATMIGDARRDTAWTATLDAFTLPTPSLVPMPDLAAALPATRPLITFDDPGAFALPEDITPKRTYPTAEHLAAAWFAHSPEIQRELATTPPQPAYLAPPHITPAKPGHPLRRPARRKTV